MRGELVLALDLGTTGVRALAVRADGSVAARVYRPLQTRFPAPERVEQDPVELWEASAEVLRAALAETGEGAAAVSAIGVVTQRATALAWGPDGTPLAPAISWQDGRTSKRVRWFRERGIPLNTLASATKYEWLLEHDPAVRKCAAAGGLRLGTPDAWLTDRLTGGDAFVTDPGNASCTALFDIGGGSWLAPLCELFGVEPDWLPSLVPTSAVVGETPASLLGAPVPVAARAGDQQAATFAQGAHAPGDAKLTLGTSAMLDVNAGDEPPAPKPGTYPLALWRLADDTRACCLEATVITAGATVDWLVALGLLPSPADLDRVAGSVPSSEGVSFVPALQGLGSPYLDDGARGRIGGLTRGSSAAHVVRAAVEGIAHRCVDLCDAVELGAMPLRVDGGLAQSDLLLRTLATLGGRELLRARETETTAIGAAYLAGLAVGTWPNLAACREVLPPPERFAPADPTDGSGDVASRRDAWRREVERSRSGG